MSDRLIGLFLAAVFVSLLGWCHYIELRTERLFGEECRRIGGRAVWDGQQHQCLRPFQPMAHRTRAAS